MTRQVAQPSSTPKRRGELDAMGMLVVVGLVFFHSAMFFYHGEFYFKADVISSAADLLTGFGGMWGMPLMFVVAGMAIWYSLRKRTLGEFVRERIKRLVVPFVMGMLLLVPPIVYASLKIDPSYHENYAQFFRRFFEVTPAFNFPIFVDGALFSDGHLWFIILLFAYTILLMPVWNYLRRPEGRRLVERIAIFCDRWGAIFLLGIPIGLIEGALGTEMSGNWNRFSYFPILIYGFLFAANPQFGRTLRKYWKLGLLLGIIGQIAWFAGYLYLAEVVGVTPVSGRGLGEIGLRFLKGMTGWFWIVTIMGMAIGVGKKGSRSEEVKSGDDSNVSAADKHTFMDRVGQYAREAQLPFYVLHYTPLIIIGFVVLQWPVSTTVQYFVIVISTLVVTLLIYDLIVRRAKLTRFLFGMRPPK
jgi:hypothetical protein